MGTSHPSAQTWKKKLPVLQSRTSLPTANRPRPMPGLPSWRRQTGIPGQPNSIAVSGGPECLALHSLFQVQSNKLCLRFIGPFTIEKVISLSSPDNESATYFPCLQDQVNFIFIAPFLDIESQIASQGNTSKLQKIQTERESFGACCSIAASLFYWWSPHLLCAPNSLLPQPWKRLPVSHQLGGLQSRGKVLDHQLIQDFRRQHPDQWSDVNSDRDSSRNTFVWCIQTSLRGGLTNRGRDGFIQQLQFPLWLLTARQHAGHGYTVTLALLPISPPSTLVSLDVSLPPGDGSSFTCQRFRVSTFLPLTPHTCSSSPVNTHLLLITCNQAQHLYCSSTLSVASVLCHARLSSIPSLAKTLLLGLSVPDLSVPCLFIVWTDY